MRSLSDTFKNLRAAGRIGLLPFIPAGYPDFQATRLLLPALEKAGASGIEIGFPFSDPIADGPTVQEAFATTLARKAKVSEVFQAVADVRSQVTIPLIGMVSYSIVFRMGPERFFATARQSGFDAMIIPDLPPPEARAVCGQIRAAGLDTILLIAPTTPPERRREITELTSGFIYYLSVTGITGERDTLPSHLPDNIRQIRQLTDVPVCVGFGISRPEHVAQLRGLADGAIVGSAVVRQLKQHINGSPQAAARAAADYCRSLLGQP